MKKQGTMDKEDIAAHIAKECKVTKVTAKRMIKAFIEAVAEGLATGKGEVVILPFGKLEKYIRKERLCSTPLGGITISPAKNAIRFKAGKALKDAIKEKGE